ncbi:MAG: peptide ABC transporter substrate-binding protein [Planctomycetota bacterium]|nr:MAG: peptide ABC transporter substrate-binding protein [Planctomycetota bacterium]
MRRSLLILLLWLLPLSGCPAPGGSSAGGPASGGAGDDGSATGAPASDGRARPAGASDGADRGEALPAWKQALQPKNERWKEAEQVFTFNNGAEPETLDPALMTGVPEGRLAGALFEGLVTLHPETLEPVPGVAERWEVSPDLLTYTFHLRKNARWSNGREVTAQDFHDSWKRALTPATACQYGYMFYPIRGAEAFHKGEEKDWNTVGIEVRDPRTLVVHLKAPCAYFLDLVAFHTLLPVPIWVVEAKGDAWSRAENIVGNGPFKLAEWLPNERMVLVKNEHYWDRDFVKLEKIVVLPLQDVETSYKLFQVGKNDWMTSVPADKLDEIEEQPEYYVQPYLGTYFYRFNVTKPPFDDARVRKALVMGFDREIITRDLLRAGQIPATWFTPEMPGYEPPRGPGYDREEARRLLAEAGYPEGKGFPQVHLLYNTNEDHKKVAESVVQQWRENLGITVSLRNTEWKVYLSEVEQLNYQIARAGWIGDYTDPNTFLDMWVTGGGNNNTGWSNARYDELIAQAAREGDPKKRMAIFRQAESLLLEELPIIPIYIYVNQGMLKTRVKGWFGNVRDQHPLKYLWIEPTD